MRSARMTKLPVVLTVPPVTRLSGTFSTGIGSPVTIDSSTALRPSTTMPSTVTHSPCRLWLKTEQRPDRTGGRAPSAELQHLSEKNQRDDDRRRLQVDGRR